MKRKRRDLNELTRSSFLTHPFKSRAHSNLGHTHSLCRVLTRFLNLVAAPCELRMQPGGWTHSPFSMAAHEKGRAAAVVGKVCGKKVCPPFLSISLTIDSKASGVKYETWFENQ